MLILIKVIYVIIVASIIVSIEMFAGIDTDDVWIFIFQMMFWFASFKVIEKTYKEIL